MNIKQFISYEIERNKKNAVMYTAIMQKALGTNVILIGHHLCFELGKDINTENEIPSADTLMFDHDVMGAVFGDQAMEIMQHLARTPTDSRDQVLELYMSGGDPLKDVYPVSGFDLMMQATEVSASP